VGTPSARARTLFEFVPHHLAYTFPGTVRASAQEAFALGLVNKVVPLKDRRPVPPGTEGDLLVRAPSQSLGYFKRPAFTAASYTPDGWFCTGDRGVLDDDGYLSITGRAKDLVTGQTLSVSGS
jgi:long-subunit acyl-CoA synthetase (AMP-forming)